MDQITLKNFRCFRERQTARLAPLTLLVGENSTGKTSFMAMFRVLWDMMVRGTESPDFKEEPYDLGSFDEIVHYRGEHGDRASAIEAGCESAASSADERLRFEVTLEKQGTVPVSVRKRFSQGDAWVELSQQEIRFGTQSGTWKREHDNNEFITWMDMNVPFPFYLSHLVSENDRWTAQSGSKKRPSKKDFEQINKILPWFRHHGPYAERPYASAPVRSKPRRTYDPARTIRDPEGQYIPMYLSDLYFQSKDKWETLKEELEKFGRSAGLFDEISVKPLGNKGSEPFQIQIRKFGEKSRKGPQRNLIDVGYGVSQVLPVVTELLRADAASTFLLQQPEVHLHPSAQAALGSLFCRIAGPQRQLVVETHSDHLLDRVRMDVRDGENNLKPADVSILFFEWQDLDVHIHSLRIDDEGNILNRPDGYRQFFLDEMERSIWKRQKSKRS